MTLQHFTTKDGLRLAYDETGAGIPLLCLAGLTRNMADFEPIMVPLRDACRLIRLDTRGRGSSQYDPDFVNYNVLRESHDALELIDHLGLAKVAVLGTSRGGLIAMALAAAHRERLLGVILNDVGPEIDARGLARIMDYLGIRPSYPDYDAAAAGLASSFAEDFPDVPLATWRAHAEHLWTASEDGLDLRYDPLLRRALIQTGAGGAVPDLWLFFAALKGLPVTVLRGDNSDILTADTVTEMGRRHPGLVAVTVRNRGHTPFLDEPESLGAIRAFLSLLGASAAP